MTPDSLNSVLEIFSWSMNQILAGLSPSKDVNDRPIAGGVHRLASEWRGALCQVRGDWAFFCECFDFVKWNTNENMCFMCKASHTIPAFFWQDFSEDAGWRGTLWTHEMYKAHLEAIHAVAPVLFARCIGFRLECVMIDVLHTVDLGVAAHVIGNVLFIMCILRGCYGGANYQERAARLNAELGKWYKATKCSSRLRGALTLERLRKAGQWPKLMGKAAAIRHMTKFALYVIQTFNNGSDYDVLMMEVCQLLDRFYTHLMSESQFMSESAKAELPRIGQKLAEKYGQLANSAYYAEERLWKLSPKLHLWEHLCEMQAILYGNPRYYWCYADEDLVGLMTEVAEGVHPATLAFSVIFKWLHTSFVDIIVEGVGAALPD